MLAAWDAGMENLSCLIVPDLMLQVQPEHCYLSVNHFLRWLSNNDDGP
jgi:hypothetical protein